MDRLFPGTDPCLAAQQYWPDFRIRFTNYWCEAITEALPQGYSANMDERINLVEWTTPIGWTEAEPPAEPWSVPSAEAGREGVVGHGSPGGRPVLVLEEERELWIRIVQGPSQKLVATLELLSPSNTGNPELGESAAKSEALRHESVHVVELDLLIERGHSPISGQRTPGRFYAVVFRGDRRPESEVYAWSIREPLPTIAIPLLAPDPDIAVGLNAVYCTAFERGRFSRRVDYGARLALGLGPEDRAWAEGMARGERPTE